MEVLVSGTEAMARGAKVAVAVQVILVAVRQQIQLDRAEAIMLMLLAQMSPTIVALTVAAAYLMEMLPSPALSA
jgi:hypothetical protein